MSRAVFAPLAPSSCGVLRVAPGAAAPPIGNRYRLDPLFSELTDEQRLAGFIGSEGVGTDRLLRSLVVRPPRQRQWRGGLPVAHAGAYARRDGVERLHLLAATSQFASLCPSSATHLVKDLV